MPWIICAVYLLELAAGDLMNLVVAPESTEFSDLTLQRSCKVQDVVRLRLLEFDHVTINIRLKTKTRPCFYVLRHLQCKQIISTNYSLTSAYFSGA